MATYFRVKFSEIGGFIFIRSAFIANDLQYRNFDFRRLNGDNFYASCKPYRNLMRFGLVTEEITVLGIVTTAKISISCQISQNLLERSSLNFQSR